MRTIGDGAFSALGDRVERRVRVRSVTALAPALESVPGRRGGFARAGRRGAALVACHRRHHRRSRPAAARRGAEHRRRRGAGAADVLGERRGVALTIRKGLPLSSGLGGSAASAVAAVVAVDALFKAHTPLETLMACAFEGERLGAGSAHGDNIAPAVYGGLVLVRVPNPPDVVRLPVPAGLDGGRRPSGPRDRDRARARAARHHRAARRRHPPVGQPRRVRRRAASRRLRADRARARGHDCRAAARAARAGPGGDQARGGRRRRARLQPVRLRAVAVRAVPRRGVRGSRRRRDDRRRETAHRRRAADLRVADRPRGARVVSTCVS